jgi:SAM-dependent methyltransferase
MTAIRAVRVDPSNREQLRAWDGDEGAYWAAHPGHFDRSVAVYHEALMQAAAVKAGDRVLDVACGTGQVARATARVAVSGRVLGVDLSAAMLDVARHEAAAEGLTNVAFEQADAQIRRFDREAFDVAVSRTGVMFFGDKLAAFRNIGQSLRPGGRLVLVTWQSLSENEWIREFSEAMAAGRKLALPRPDAPGPFSLADPGCLRALLTEAGYTGITVESTAGPVWFGTDADDAFNLVSGLLGWMLDGLDDAGRARATGALRATIAAHESPEGVLYGSAAWTTSAERT